MNDNEERLVILESEFRALKESVERFMEQSDIGFDKLNEKLDAVILDNTEKPSSIYCRERQSNCEVKFGELHGRVNKVKDDYISKSITALISVLCTIIGVLTTLLVVACK